MNLSLATVLSVSPDGCQIETLDGRTLSARYSSRVINRIRIVPRQLVAVDSAPDTPEVVWRWFRGPVLLLVDGYAVVDYRVYQPGFHYPISVALVPEHLRDLVAVGDEVFYTTHEDGAIAAVLRDGRPHDPAHIAADLFPAIEQVYAEGDSA
jgi:hypothetical protein